MAEEIRVTERASEEPRSGSQQRVGMRTEQEPSANSTSDAVGGGGVGGFDLWPGFKTPPTDPSRDMKQRAPLTVAPEPQDYDGGEYDDDQDEACEHCDGRGYTDCLCGGDFCVCSNNGEEPCYYCC